MKFEYEKLTSSAIIRRVIEHERHLNGKRVSTVVLTRAEWAEFLQNEAPGLYQEPRLEYAKYQLRRPAQLSYPTDPYPMYYETTITVRPE